MPNHYYSPKAEAIEATELAVSTIEDPILIVVKAENAEEAFVSAKHIINMNNWELHHVEE